MALQHSRSKVVEDLYLEAERLGRADGLCWLPEWAGTWPGGQLASFSRSTDYVGNIERYYKAGFEKVMVINLKTDLHPSNLTNTLLQIVSHTRNKLGCQFEANAKAYLRKDGGAEPIVANVSEALPLGLEPNDEDKSCLRKASGERYAALESLLRRRKHGQTVRG